MAKVNEQDDIAANQLRIELGWEAHDGAIEHLLVPAFATYREEIEARYAGVVEALEEALGGLEAFCSGATADTITKAHKALAKIGRG